MDYIQHPNDNSNEFYSVAHSDGIPSPPPPTTSHSSQQQTCFQSDQIIIPEGQPPKVEQTDVFDVCNPYTKFVDLSDKLLPFRLL